MGTRKKNFSICPTVQQHVTSGDISMFNRNTSLYKFLRPREPCKKREGREDERLRKVRGRFTSRLYPSFREEKRRETFTRNFSFFFSFLAPHETYTLPLPNLSLESPFAFRDPCLPATPFLSIYKSTAQKRVTREIVRINSLMSGKWFLSNDPRYNAANRTSVD